MKGTKLEGTELKGSAVNGIAIQRKFHYGAKKKELPKRVLDATRKKDTRVEGARLDDKRYCD